MAHILVVDDDEDFRWLAREILEQEGYEVTTVDDGASAFVEIDTSLPDVILLDLFMPEFSGFQVYGRLQETPETAAIPVLVITGHDDAQEKLRAMGLPYLLKPFRAQALLDVLEKLLPPYPG